MSKFLCGNTGLVRQVLAILLSALYLCLLPPSALERELNKLSMYHLTAEWANESEFRASESEFRMGWASEDKSRILYSWTYLRDVGWVVRAWCVVVSSYQRSYILLFFYWEHMTYDTDSMRRYRFMDYAFDQHATWNSKWSWVQTVCFESKKMFIPFVCLQGSWEIAYIKDIPRKCHKSHSSMVRRSTQGIDRFTTWSDDVCPFSRSTEYTRMHCKGKTFTYQFGDGHADSNEGLHS